MSKKYSRILNFEKKSINKIPQKSIDKYFKDLEVIQPSSIFITHQRVAGLMPICLAANRLKIKTSTAIYSWDNLPKARLCVKVDYYLVWSSWMQQEMKDYYPEIEESKVLHNAELEGIKLFNKTTRRTKAVRKELKTRTQLLKRQYTEETGKKMSYKAANQKALLELEREAVEHHRDMAQQVFRMSFPVIIKPGEEFFDNEEAES